MKLLYWLESIRLPFLDKIMSLLTNFGDETLFLVITIVIFWCINKKNGYFLLLIGFAGTIINQFLKITFKVDRPWVKDPDFKPVEAAIEGATGYSFPSGHTQTSIGLYGALALTEKKPWIRIVSLLLCLIVPFSRMYLGVHTPQDVLTSVVIALSLIFIFKWVFSVIDNKPNVMWFVIGALSLLTVALLVYVKSFGLTTESNIISAEKNAFKILGCSIGLVAVWYFDNKYIKFETKAVWWAQIIKCFLGLGIIFIIKTFLKDPLYAVFSGSYVADLVRYLIIVLFAGTIWPATFKWFARFGNKN